MDNIVRQTIVVLRGMWKYRWVGLFTTWAVAVIGAVIVMSLPKQFEASARIFVNTDSILKPLMTGVTAVQPNGDQRLAMLSRVVVSRPNVDKLIRSSGLDEKVKTTEEREKLIDDVMKVLEIKTAGSNNLYMVTFRDRKPERAQKVVELLVAMFIDSSSGGRRSDADAAETFLDEQAKIYEKKLEEAENRRKEFKIRYLALGAADGKDYVARMAEASAQLNQAQLQLREAENSRDALKSGLAREDPLADSGQGKPNGGESIADIQARIDSMKRNLDGLLQKYTDSHPDVVGTRRVIAELEQQRQHIIEEHKKNGIPLGRAQGSNPLAYDQLRVSLTQAEASAASLRARVADHAARYARLRDMAQQMPQLEAEMAQLNRDYEVNKKNYDNLISRRESASITGDMQGVAGVEDFRLVDPPRVSPRPVSPNRGLLLPLTVLLALSSGFGIMFAASEIRPTFFDGQSLREMTGLPVLGVISLEKSAALKLEERRDIERYARHAAALLVLYVGIVAASYWLTLPTSGAAS